MNTKRNGRPIGARIQEVCEIVESIGPSTYTQVRVRMDGIVQHNAHKYCSRAVGLGFMTVQRSAPGEAFKPVQFTIIEGWRRLLDRQATTCIARVAEVKPVKAVPVVASRWAGVASVWGMAA